MDWFSFLQGRVPLGATNNLSQALRQGRLPYYSTIGYPQFRVLNPIRELQQPQIYVNPAALQAGLGGLIAGGFVFQSLTQNPNPQQ